MWQTLVGVFVGVSSLFGGLFATSAPASQPAAVAQTVTAPAATTTPPSPSGQAPSSSSGQATIVEQHITQPVIERTVERIVREPAQEPVTLPILALLFNQLDNKLTGKINNITASNNQGLAPVWQAVAQSQRIDHLTNTTITTPIVVNPTVNGGTLSGVTVSANSITTGTLSAATTTITGDLTVSGTVTGGTLSVSGLSSGGAVSAPYFTATSTTATSSFQALAVAGYATLATTTIAGPLTLSQTPSALLSTDSLGQIVATTTLAASYLALPQGYTLVGGASGTAQATSSLYVANTGNVGIGTTSPWAKFSINNSTADTAGQPLFTIASSTASATTTAFIVTNNGNVGIGTTGPGHKLTVSGSGTSGGFLVTGGDAAAVNVLSNNGYDWQYNTIHSLSAGGLAIQTKWNTGATSLALQPDGGNVGIGTTSPWGKLSVKGAGTGTGVAFGVSDSADVTRMVVQDNGNVGIGTTGPNALIAVSTNRVTALPTEVQAIINTNFGGTNGTGGRDTLILANGGTDPTTTIQGAALSFKAPTYGSTGSWSSGRILSYFDTSGGSNPGYGGAILAFQYPTADNTFATGMVLKNGNVGIGTANPATKLDVYGNINIKSASTLAFGSETGENTYIQGSAASHYVRIVNNNSEALRIIDGGNVGIGTTSPALKLQVNGNIGPNTDNTYTDGTATYRWSAVYAANGTIQTSDARLKSNVTDLNYGLADLMKLHPVSFTWTSNPEQGTKLGFIAQEVQPVMPEVVNTGDDANHTLGITYTEFIPAIVRAIQELNGKIGTLADTVAGFADHFVTKELSFDRAAGDTMTLKTLCLSDANGTSCYTRSQLDSFVQSQGAAQTAAAASTQGANATPATLTLNGNATSTIALGASYNDLGATFTHSGITETIYATSTVDTSVAGTTTLDYWATWYPDPAATTSAETLHTVREVVVTDPNAEQGNATNTTQTATSTGQ